VTHGKRFVVTVFGSSKPREGDAEYETAREVGRLLAEAGFTVCNGGYGGTMEASARGAKEAGGATIGVVARIFSTAPNPFIDRKIIEDSLVNRLMKLIDLGDAYVVLKGGTGTLVELALVWELMNKRLAAEKPILVMGGFWSPVIKTLNEELAYEGRGSATKHVTVVSTPKKCVEVLKERLRK
jgi:uncharacterized protein (TIGR00730 family)